MRRREFIAAHRRRGGTALALRPARSSRSRCGGSVCCCPQPRTMRNFRPGSRVPAGAGDVGWTNGRNMRIDIRWTRAMPNRRKHAAELVDLAPDVILAYGGANMGPLHRRLAPCRSYSRLSPIRSVPALSTAWRGRAATLPASCSSNTASAGNGWSAQADRARRDAGGGPSGCHSPRR